MTPSLASLKTKFSALLTAIADKLDTKLDKTSATVTPVNEYRTIAANTTVQYDLQTLIGVGYTNFDLKTADITVLAKDTSPASPMYNAYANAEALITYGLKDTRYILVANQTDASLDVYVKVVVHPVAV